MTFTRRHPDLDDELFSKLMHLHEQAFADGRQINSKGHQGVNECSIDGVSYMIKCYVSSSLVDTTRFLLGNSRADRSFIYAGKLDTLAIPVAKHLLAIKHVSFGKSRAYLIMEKAPGIALFDYLQPENNLTLSQANIDSIAMLVTSLHKQGIAHGDLHTRNLIIADDNSVRLIDFDNARMSESGIKKDMQRFTKALAKKSAYEPAITAAMKKAGHPYLNH